MDGVEAEFIIEIFPGNSDPLCIWGVQFSLQEFAWGDP